MKEYFKGMWQTIGDWFSMISPNNDVDPNSIKYETSDDHQDSVGENLEDEDFTHLSNPEINSQNIFDVGGQLGSRTEEEYQVAYRSYIDDD